MTMPVKLKKGDQVVCTHYKDKKKFTITEVKPGYLKGKNIEEIWVFEEEHGYWFGPRNWFRKV